MRKTALFYLFFGILMISCQAQTEQGDSEKIQLIGLSEKHPDKIRMEHLLNNSEEEFVATEPEKDLLKSEDLIQGKYGFQTKDSAVSILLIFCKDQADALAVSETGFTNQARGVNGATLFVVTGEDENRVNEVLSYFAGEE